MANHVGKFGVLKNKHTLSTSNNTHHVIQEWVQQGRGWIIACQMSSKWLATAAQSLAYAQQRENKEQVQQWRIRDWVEGQFPSSTIYV